MMIDLAGSIVMFIDLVMAWQYCRKNDVGAVIWYCTMASITALALSRR